MNGGDNKESSEPGDAPEGEQERADAARDAAGKILDPSMPPAAAGLVIDSDPRLNQPSESEEALKRLVESEAEAAGEGDGED